MKNVWYLIAAILFAVTAVLAIIDGNILLGILQLGIAIFLFSSGYFKEQIQKLLKSTKNTSPDAKK